MPRLKELIAKANSQAEEHSWKCMFSASGICKAKKAGAFAMAFGQRDLLVLQGVLFLRRQDWVLTVTPLASQAAMPPTW